MLEVVLESCSCLKHYKVSLDSDTTMARCIALNQLQPGISQL
jgi:hypothetical protein